MYSKETHNKISLLLLIRCPLGLDVPGQKCSQFVPKDPGGFDFVKVLVFALHSLKKEKKMKSKHCLEPSCQKKNSAMIPRSRSHPF